MAVDFDVATTLQTVSKTVQEQYRDKWLEQEFVSGKITNRIFSPGKVKVVGDGVTFQYKRYPGNVFRAGNDPYSEFQAGTAFDPRNLKLRWNERDPSNHDFTHLCGSVRLGMYDIQRAGDPGLIVSIVDQVTKDMRMDFGWKWAVLQNVRRTGKIASVNGNTGKNLDSNSMADATAYTSGSTSIRVYVDGGSIALFRPGVEYDIYNGNTLYAANVLCDGEINATDTASNSTGSVGLSITTRTTGITNFNTLQSAGDNYAFYLAGSKDKAMWSREEWMTQPGASDTFINGINRKTSYYQFLLPLITRIGATAAPITKGMLDDAATAAGFTNDEPDMARVGLCNDRVLQTLRNQFEAAAFVTWTSKNDVSERYGNMGLAGLNYQHPNLGNIKFVTDPMMNIDKLDLINMSVWKACTYGRDGLNILPGNVGSYWNRVPSSTPGNGLGKTFSMDAYSDAVSYCEDVKSNIRISNITP